MTHNAAVPPVVTTRPIADEERALLHVPTGGSRWFGLVATACALVIAFLLTLLGAAWFPRQIVTIAIVAATIMSIVAYVWIQRHERKRLQLRQSATARLAASDMVQASVFIIDDAIVIEESEDEGISYYLLLDDGRTLFLSGQYLHEPAQNGFPWRSFELVSALSGESLRVTPLGPPLTPSAARAHFTAAELQSVPADGTIVVLDFNALARDASRVATDE
jgi:hypothetical protein